MYVRGVLVCLDLLNRRGNGHQDTQISVRPDAMGFADVGDQDGTWFCWNCRFVVTEKGSRPFDNVNTYLSLQIVRMYGKNSASGNVEIYYFKKFRIVDNKILHAEGVKLTGLVQFIFFH